MTDTGQIPGEGLPEDAGMVEQPGIPAAGAYTYLDASENAPEEDDLLLMPSAQGAWSDPQPGPAQPLTSAALPVHEQHPGAPAQGAVPQAAPVVEHQVAEQLVSEHHRSASAPLQTPLGPEATPAFPAPEFQAAAFPAQDFPAPEFTAQEFPAPQFSALDYAAAPAPAPLAEQVAPAFVVDQAADSAFAEQDAAQAAALQASAVQAAVHETGAHEAGGRDSGSVDLSGVRIPPASATPTPPPARRPLHMGPPVPDSSSGGVVRSLADRGPAGAPAAVPVRHAGPATTGLEYLDIPRDEPATVLPGPQLGEIPPQAGAPWDPQPQQSHVTPQAPAETVVPEAAVVETAVPESVAPEPVVAEEAPLVAEAPEAAQVAAAVPAPEPAPVVAEPEAAPVAVQAAAAPMPVPQPEPVADHALEQAPAPAPTGEFVPVEGSVPTAPNLAPTPVAVIVPEQAPEAAPEPVAEPLPVAEAEQAVAPEQATVPAQAAAEPEPAPEPAQVVEPEPQAAEAVIPAPREEAEPVEPVAAEAANVPEPVEVAEAVDAGQPAPEAVEAPAPEVVEAPAPEAVQVTEPAVVPAPEAVQVPEPAAVPAPEAVQAPEPELVAEPEPQTDPQPEPEPEAETQPQAETQPEAEQQPEPVAPEPVAAESAPAPGYADAEREAVLRVMRERRDIRNGFRSDPIPHEVLLRVLEAAHTAPSVGHSQPWDFVVIRSAETRRTMHELAQRQREAYAKSLPKGRAKQFKELKIEAILDTPVNIVVTADPTRGGRHTLGRHTQPQMAPYSSALAVENLWLAARAEGLGVGWVSFFDEREMVRALGLPEHLEVVAYLCVGYVDEFPEEPELMQAGWSKRRPLSWVVHEETYGRRALPGEEPHDLLQETVSNIRPLDAKALGEAWERQKRMTKPAGALGMLEIISAQLSGLSRMCPPPIPEPAAVAIFAGDHGVHAQGVTAWPQEVTAQMVANFLGGGAVCNAFANQVGAEVCVIDVGVASDLPATPGLLPRKVRPGTSDFTTGPALSREDVLAAVEVGIETARDLVAAGNKALLTGEMGIANTTVSAALISVYTGIDPSEITGRGTGINDEMHARKVDVVRRALELHAPDPADPIGVLSAVGGLEHAALVGFILGGASLRTPVVLDGVSAGAAALVARAVAPEALAACIAGHRSAEPGHVAALNKLGLRPLVDLDLRLGEGTGALLALPVVQSAARAMHEVATFDSAGVTEK
ncbi:nicotinate-nucleotide--dimethylbenzimidazole phosphoribosyltransferase [Streptomyces sp. NPDC051907]|uniref:nicotinate-nucleotide--dimethylbenzimidazole phosphoribosyltransferase n=1 Tax=Streptomyces sp. NPDC051907 TaxID=3155284 RepID=UPI0034231110